MWFDIAIRTKLSPRLAVALREEYNLQWCIETGTHFGNTAELAAFLFRQVLTWELHPEEGSGAEQRLACLPNVHRYYGDSVAGLKSLDIKEMPPTLIWLDAHWTGRGPRTAIDSPVLDELDAIGDTYPKDVILIDDVRLFGTEGWPSREDIEARVRRVYLKIRYIGDVLVATPSIFGYEE